MFFSSLVCRLFLSSEIDIISVNISNQQTIEKNAKSMKELLHFSMKHNEGKLMEQKHV